MMDVRERIEDALNANISHISHLSGGCVGDVRRVDLSDGRRLVAKIGSAEESDLALEGLMLNYLAERSSLPVPEVLVANESLLIMTFIEGDDSIGASAQKDAAHHLAALHDISAPDFGFDRDTLIGGLRQPNPQERSWITFFRDHRLLHMGQIAHAAGRLPTHIRRRLETMCSHLDQWLAEPEKPSLLHGDVWSGNVLVKNGKVSGFVDPAIYYGDPEIELAFTTLFGTFGDDFFHSYQEARPLSPGFFEDRCDIYNLYPLLVHVRLFGESYVRSVDKTLQRFGF